MQDVDAVRGELLARIEAADLDGLERLRVAELGKKGRITALMRDLAGLDPDARRLRGAALNALKEEVADALERRRTALADAALDARLEGERVDLSLPVRPERAGRIHPISQTIDEVVAIFGAMGFAVGEGPDIEDDWTNFGALNIPPEHPARQEMDTFYLPGERDGRRLVLRTHTSPVQVRTMLNQQPPIRIIAPGRTYRSDYDAKHSTMYQQVEGLVIDRDLHIGHLKG
jgi:phenylalanyl-tRNA synthetase alpha chain